jgi:hypothetical protein
MHQQEQITQKTDRYLYDFENTYNCRFSPQARAVLQKEILTFSFGTTHAENTHCDHDHHNVAYRIAFARLKLRLRDFSRKAAQRDSQKGGSTVIRKWEIKKWIRECRCWPR